MKNNTCEYGIRNKEWANEHRHHRIRIKIKEYGIRR